MYSLLTIKLGLLKDFDLANIDIMEGVDGLALLLNVLAYAVWDTAGQKVGEKRSSEFTGITRESFLAILPNFMSAKCSRYTVC